MVPSVMMKTRFRYKFGGVILDTEMPLEGGLCAVRGHEFENTDIPHVTIDYGVLPKHLDGAIKSSPLWESTANAFLYNYPKAGRFMVTGGKKILIERGEHASDWNVVNALVRAPLGALLHQRGHLVLHASAITIGAKCYIFMGNSCAGKSTLAAYMVHQRGCGFLTDEICSIEFKPEKFYVHAASPEVRLFNDSKNQFNLQENEATKNPELPKNHIDQRERIEAQPVEVAAIYNLSEPRGKDTQPKISLIEKRLAMDFLKQNTYRQKFITGREAAANHFKRCATVLDKVPIFEFNRPKDFAKIDETMSMLIDHIKSGHIEESA